MRTLFLIFLIAIPVWLFSQTIYVANIEGSINPSTASYVHSVIQKAEEKNAHCVIVKLNTPGGLLAATRNIVSDFLESNVPIIVYVMPGGAQAASAGVFITLSAHIAAMAPGTNIGAASPVALQGEMDSIMLNKAMNDAAAFIRTIAEKRQRNVKWAEEAVRKAESITETEALQKNVIDFISKDLTQLLNQADGKKVIVKDDTLTLHTKNAIIEPIEMSFSEKLFSILSDPNIAYILFLLGIYGLLFEIYNPGAILPGVVGAICMILALYSLNTLPINYAGLGLIVVAIILFIAEIKIVSHGLLTVGGIISLILGALLLIRTDNLLEFMEISLTVIISSAVLTALFFLLIIGLGLKAQRGKPVTGMEGIIGEIGETITPLDPNGKVRIHGEIWNAVSSSGSIKKGKAVKVIGIENLKLFVQEVQ